MPTSDLETMTQARLLLEEVGEGALAQAHFYRGECLDLLRSELEWAIRVLSRPLSAGKSSRHAAMRGAVRELLRCWVSLQDVTAQAGEREAWPDLIASQQRIAAFLRCLLQTEPSLFSAISGSNSGDKTAEEDIQGQWRECDDGMELLRLDNLALSCIPYKLVWLSKVGGVFCGQAQDVTEAMRLAECQAARIFGAAPLP